MKCRDQCRLTGWEESDMCVARPCDDLQCSGEKLRLTREALEWRRVALHALHDLALLGVDISLIGGVTDDVLRQVDDYSREMTSYS